MNKILCTCSIVFIALAGCRSQQSTTCEQHTQRNESSQVSRQVDSTRDTIFESTHIHIEYCSDEPVLFHDFGFNDDFVFDSASVSSPHLPFAGSANEGGGRTKIKSVDIIMTKAASTSSATVTETSDTVTTEQTDLATEQTTSRTDNMRQPFTWILVVVYLIFAVMVWFFLFYLIKKYHTDDNHYTTF